MVTVSFSDWNYRKGMRFFSEKEYERCAAHFRKAAECGHPEAQFRLGKMRSEGLGVPVDNDEALEWVRKAAAQGHPEAKRELGERIGGFVAGEGALAVSEAAAELGLREVVEWGADCLLELRPYDVVDYLEKYSRLLPPGPRSRVYYTAGIHFLQEEDDGVTALNCLAEAVRNAPDDQGMKEALFDAAWKVVSGLERRKSLFESEVRALALACETLGGLKPVQQDVPDGRP